MAAALAVQQGLTFAYLLEGHEVSAAVVGVAFGAVGAAVVWRQPRHRLGWLFILISQLLCLSEVGARYGSVSPPLPLSGLATWAGNVLWVPAMAISVGLLTLLFPDGRPRPRLRPVVWIAVAACVVGSAALMLVEAGRAYSGVGRFGGEFSPARRRRRMPVRLFGGRPGGSRRPRVEDASGGRP